LATGRESLPGWSSMNMSLSAVFGRSSASASSCTTSLNSGSISSVTSARPCSSSTLPTSPTFTPETRTVWPWPGVTACAVENSALMRFGLSSITGKRRRWLARM
jgi:hypothetical protein